MNSRLSQARIEYFDVHIVCFLRTLFGVVIAHFPTSDAQVRVTRGSSPRRYARSFTRNRGRGVHAAVPAAVGSAQEGPRVAWASSLPFQARAGRSTSHQLAVAPSRVIGSESKGPLGMAGVALSQSTTGYFHRYAAYDTVPRASEGFSHRAGRVFHSHRWKISTTVRTATSGPVAAAAAADRRRPRMANQHQCDGEATDETEAVDAPCHAVGSSSGLSINRATSPD